MKNEFLGVDLPVHDKGLNRIVPTERAALNAAQCQDQPAPLYDREIS